MPRKSRNPTPLHEVGIEAVWGGKKEVGIGISTTDCKLLVVFLAIIIYKAAMIHDHIWVTNVTVV